MKKKYKTIFYFLYLLIAYIYLHVFKRDLLNKNIWLISEKKDEARDNGYHLFSHIKKNHPEINAFYVIKKSSVDFEKIKDFCSIIEADSFDHCIYFLAAKYNINSQPFGAYPFSFSYKILNLIKKYLCTNQKVVFLQHGIIKDYLSNDFYYGKCNIDYFICSAAREYSFVKDTYGYPSNAIGCIGLARFDKLQKNDKITKQILIMPTWRKWLSCQSKLNIPNEKEKSKFLDSEFFAEYKNILTNKELLDFLKKREYKIIFYLHYKLQGYTELFKKYENDVVLIADKNNYDVQELLIDSDVLITDYSSVFFDFAYMNKPLLYFQFDSNKFNEQHYSKGYFSYELDGFGPRCEEYSEIEFYIRSMIKNNCEQLAEYETRVNDFFMYRDTKNCERTFNAIKNIK